MITIILIFIALIGCMIISKYFNKSGIIYLTERDKCESYIELRLYDALSKNGYNPKTQVKCGPYRIDIALPEYRLAIECDGKKFHYSLEQKRHDARKNYYLKKNGWRVCRISGKSINNNINKVLNHIERRKYV